MKILNKEEMISHCKKHPNGGVAFCEHDGIDNYASDLMITLCEDFGATDLLPSAETGETYAWDWSLREAKDDDCFAVFDRKDILMMMARLLRALAETE